VKLLTKKKMGDADDEARAPLITAPPESGSAQLLSSAFSNYTSFVQRQLRELGAGSSNGIRTQPGARIFPGSDDRSGRQEDDGTDVANPAGGDLDSATLWLQNALPFLALLLVVFLYRHLLSILTFFWLTSLLHNANCRLRQQVLLKENRSRRALCGVIGLLVAQICCILLLQGGRLLQQLQLRRSGEWSAEPPALTSLLWDVLLADLCARASLLLAKSLIGFLMPSRTSPRRTRRLYAAIEAVGICYRMLLPMPLWFHWLFHAAEDIRNVPSIWAVACSHFYVGFKLVSIAGRVRSAAAAAKGVIWFELPIGKYASEEEVMEQDGGDGCTVCTEDFTNPVRLECGHLYCEEVWPTRRKSCAKELLPLDIVVHPSACGA
jgi:hypothetical protein